MSNIPTRVGRFGAQFIRRRHTVLYDSLPFYNGSLLASLTPFGGVKGKDTPHGLDAIRQFVVAPKQANLKEAQDVAPPFNAPLLLSEKYSLQFMKVLRILNDRKAFTREIIENQALIYYNHLGLHEYYFQTAAPHIIANNLECVIAAQILREATSDSEMFPLFHQESEGEVFFFAKASIRNRQASQNYLVEKQLENKYFGLDGITTPWRMQCYRSVGSLFDDPEDHLERLRTYFLQRPEYPTLSEPIRKNETDLGKITDVYFYTNKKGTATEEIFDRMNREVVNDDTGSRLFISTRKGHDNVYRLDFAFRRGSQSQNFFTKLGDCITMWGCYSQRKYMEPLANGVSIVSAFLEQLPIEELTFPEMPIEQRIHRLVKSIKMQFILPDAMLSELVKDRVFHIHEAAFCTVVAKFIQHFTATVGPAFSSIEQMIKKFDSYASMPQQDLYEVKTRLKLSPFSEDMIVRAIFEYPEIVKRLYKEFQEMHHPRPYKERGNILAEWKDDCPLQNDILSLDSPDASRIFMLFRFFNKSILKTNFWKDEKMSLAFRLDPRVLPEADYPQLPYSIFFFIGLDFVGFHVGFGNVARGGIRVVQSLTNQMYEQNKRDIFDEAYKLASTQHFKNKDIPEGGSKGVILLSKTNTKEEADHLTQQAFRSYIDGMLDLLLPDARVVERTEGSHVCFLGPDENTGVGGLMDWAAHHAKLRNAWFWKAFTTGKLPINGGIPHDLFGMTTASVEMYVQGILGKAKLQEENVTKLLIGGPDGDLGSNTLLRSKARTTAVVDGSGVLYDPEGLNLAELHRLALKRFAGETTQAMDFEASLLSSKGFKVPQNARNVKLPDGTEILSGFQFRNEFHLNPLSSADLFNPCGGRPASVTPFNVDKMFDENGSPRFRYIVEGANVFITDDARRIMEHKGCILFKDASTNKGGVTSSSHEVLAALAFNDEEFAEHMQVRDEQNLPAFYNKYVHQIIERIEENAKLEFQALWKEGERTGKYRCDLSDILSFKIIDLKAQILQSDLLWDREELVSKVLSAAIPNVLVPDMLDLNTIRERVPHLYLKSIFASYLASRFYYGEKFTEDLSIFKFFDFVNEIERAH